MIRAATEARRLGAHDGMHGYPACPRQVAQRLEKIYNQAYNEAAAADEALVWHRRRERDRTEMTTVRMSAQQVATAHGVLAAYGVELLEWRDVSERGMELHLVDRCRELVKVGWHPTLGFVVHVPGSLPSGYGLGAAARLQAELAEATRCLVVLLQEGLPVGIGGVVTS